MRHITVVGASVAGVNAVEALREAGYDGAITLIDADAHLPYDLPPLSKDVLIGKARIDDVLLRPASWYDELNVQLTLGVPARGIDSPHREVVLADGRRVGYDGLVLATGSIARKPASDAWKEVRTLRTVSDAEALRDELLPGRHLVVIGAGFIGLEVAASARRLGVEVTVIEAAAAPLARVVGQDVGWWFQQLHARNGVTVLCDTTVVDLSSSATGTKVSLADGSVLLADVVVAGVGAAPATSWLANSGIAIGDGVLCDPSLNTTLPGVAAAGDVARWTHPLFQESLRVEQWTNAAKQGAHAAHALLGEQIPFVELPYFWSDQHDAKALCIGLATGADQVSVQRMDTTGLSVAFGHRGVIRGAVCVNAPRDLARYRQQILRQAPMEDLGS